MIISKHVSLIVLAGLLGTVLTQEGCGSDNSAPTGPGTAGSSGAASSAAGAAVGGGSSGMASTTAGAPGAGAPSAGAPASGGGGAGGSAAGAGTGGSAAGAGGSAAGSGGTGGGAAGMGTGGGSAGMGTGGGSPATFMAVKTLFGASCGVGQCHNAASMNLDFQGTNDLHGLLTKPIPTGIAHCVGSTLVTANDANSFLVTVVKTGGSCPTGGGSAIGKMPDNCGQAGKPACLTAAQVKTITDWIAAGAPN